MIILICGIIITIIGAVCAYRHDNYSKYPNLTVGYKMKSAMKSNKTWKEANKYVFYAARMTLILACFMEYWFKDYKSSYQVLYALCAIFILICPILATQIHIKRKFQNN